MQIWDEVALDAHIEAERVPGTAPFAIAIRSSDPLARRALASALSIAGLDGHVRHEGDAGAADVVLYDDGPTPPAGPLRLPPGAAGRWLALVASGARARAAMSGGFHGALGRDAAPEILAAAIQASRQGIVVLDPRFARHLLPTPSAQSEALSLTPREQQVLELLAEGISNKEIAAQLGVSPHTAKFHVTALLDKLGAETRTEAVVLAARSGLLDL